MTPGNHSRITTACDHIDVKLANDSCQFVLDYCQDLVYGEFYYCNLSGNIFYYLPIFICGMFLCFLLLGSTADDFLTPSLEKLKIKFGFSETLAGVTLLAFANGAPDVLASFAASGTGSDGIFLSMGAIFGAGLFVMTFVFGRCIYICTELKVKHQEVGRDIYFFILTICVLFAFAIYSKITLIMAICFIALYAVYVSVVLIVENNRNKQEEKISSQLDDNDFQTLKLKEMLQHAPKVILTHSIQHLNLQIPDHISKT